jgi:hypothetical protein
MNDPLKPSPALLCKLGSIAVHVEEMLSVNGHEFDRIALETLCNDIDVQSWLMDMSKSGMVPVRRTSADLKLSTNRRKSKGKR